MILLLICFPVHFFCNFGEGRSNKSSSNSSVFLKLISIISSSIKGVFMLLPFICVYSCKKSSSTSFCSDTHIFAIPRRYYCYPWCTCFAYHLHFRAVPCVSLSLQYTVVHVSRCTIIFCSLFTCVGLYSVVSGAIGIKRLSKT